MIFKILRYVRGYLRIRVSGYGAERFLNACRYRNIKLWNLTSVGDDYEMNLSIQGFQKLKPVVRKTRVKIVIVKRVGFPFFLNRYRKRKIFFAGACLCVLLIFGLSRFIWEIDIRGNLSRTDETLLEFLDTKDVRNGMRVSEVDCVRIVKDIRKEYNDIIWVSASIEGTKLIIQVKENRDVISADKDAEEEEKETKNEPTDIVADRDCVITDIVTRGGIAQVKEGDEVKEGDVLVSGQIPIHNDAGEVIAYQYQEADADIRGQTVISYSDSQSLTYEERQLYDVEKKEYYVRIGSFRISFGGIKNNYDKFEQYSEERQGKLLSNFYLPVFAGKRSVIPYRSSEKAYEEEELRRILSERFDWYCEDLMKKGVEILQNDVKIYTGSKEAQAKGNLTVIMQVGTGRPSQLLAVPEQTDENEQSGE